MIRQRHRTTALLYLSGDLAATLLAFAAAWVLRFELQILERQPHQPELYRYLELVPFLLLVWPVVFYFHGLYQMRRGRSRVDEMLTLALAVLLASLLLSVFTAWYRPPVGPVRPDGTFDIFTYSRGFLALFPAINLLFVGAARMGIRSMLRRRRLRGESLQLSLIHI